MPPRTTTPATQGTGPQGPADTAQEPTPAGPMIRFVGRDREGRKIYPPPTSIHGVLEIKDLPSAEEQVAGFRHERAREIVRTFPRLYKRVAFDGAGQPLPEPEPNKEDTAEPAASSTGIDTSSEVTDNG